LPIIETINWQHVKSAPVGTGHERVLGEMRIGVEIEDALQHAAIASACRISGSSWSACYCAGTRAVLRNSLEPQRRHSATQGAAYEGPRPYC
jgi:hypothetical protein